MIEQIPDASLTASSVWMDLADHGPKRSRFTVVADEIGEGAWSSWQLDANQWIQAEFMTVKNVFKVATKGKNEDRSLFQWVTRYQLKYGISSTQADFEYVTSADGEIISFDGNNDRDSIVENEFPTVLAKFIRLNPIGWHQYISMRCEVYGC